MPAFVDTNVLIHYLTGEDDAKAKRCLALLQRAQNRAADLFTSDLVVAEAVWVLQSRSGVSRERIRDLLLPVMRLPGLRVPNKQSWPRVFDLYCERRIDFIDAYNAVTMERAGITDIYSYDRDFDGLEGITRMEP